MIAILNDRGMAIIFFIIFAAQNFKADKRLNDGAVVFVIPAILHDLVGREIKTRIDQEEAIMKQKEIKTQKQAFIDALNKERQK